MIIKLFFFFITVTTVSYAQMEPCFAVLKSGDTLSVYGKITRNALKYKTSSESKSKKIFFPEIDYIKIRYSKVNTKKYKFFQRVGFDNYIAVEEIVSGSKVKLYIEGYYFSSTGAGGIAVNQQVVKYYIKKVSDERLTYLGDYPALGIDLKLNVLKYFNDCDKLIEKINNKEFRIREGVGKIATYYNEQCKLE